uniref:Uncharacterized protein n=1 Tax=Panagrolaimus sp. PS1159 TaxID=55785 RepID=A0AC35G5F5_9BILA
MARSYPRTQKCLLNEKETKLALFWCCKIAEVFGVQEAVGVFAVLASQCSLGTEETPLTTDMKKHGGKMKVSLSILGRLVQRLCNNEIATSLKPISPADVFWTIWSSIEGADTLPNAPNEEMKFSALPEVAVELLTPPFETLKEIGVLLFTQSADLNQTIENEQIYFSKYSTMTEEDLHELCIPSVDVSDILENLCKNGILLKHQQFYKLSVTANFENSGITQCYAPIVE